MTVTVSVKIPARILERIPKAGNGRSGFIVLALEEKLARQQPPEWKPTTKRGRRLAAGLKKGEEVEGFLSGIQHLDEHACRDRVGFRQRAGNPELEFLWFGWGRHTVR